MDIGNKVKFLFKLQRCFSTIKSETKMRRILFAIFILLFAQSITLLGQNKIEMSLLIDFDATETPLVNSNIVITNLHNDKAIVIEDVEFINQMPSKKTFCRNFYNAKNDCKCCPSKDHTACRYFLLPNQTTNFNRFLRIDEKVGCIIKWREIDVQDIENHVCAINPIVPTKKIINPETVVKPQKQSASKSQTRPGNPGSQGNPAPSGPPGPPDQILPNWKLLQTLNDSVQNHYQDIGFEYVVVKHFEKFQTFTDTIELVLDEQSNFSNCGISKDVFRPDYQMFLDKFSCSEININYDLEYLKCFELNEELVIAYNKDTNFVFLRKKNKLIRVDQPNITTESIDYLQLLKKKKKGILCHLNRTHFDDIVEVVRYKSKGKSPSIGKNKLSTTEFIEILKRAKEANLTLRLKGEWIKTCYLYFEEIY